MNKKIKKFAYIQNWGTYDQETLVCVGMSPEEILAYAKKHKFNKQTIKNFENEIPKLNKLYQGGCAITCVSGNTTCLILRNYEDTWSYWETLMHECYHLVYHVFGRNLMSTEEEAFAYQLEFMFRSIRRKLQNKF